MPDRSYDGNPELSREAEAAREQYQQSKAGRNASRRDLELVRFADMHPRLDGRPLVKGAGDTPSANDHVPADTPCVNEATWRQFCAEGMISDSDKPEAKRKAFKRASEALLANSRIGKWGELVWLIRP